MSRKKCVDFYTFGYDNLCMIFFDRVKTLVKAANMSIEGFLQDTFQGDISIHVYNGWRRRKILPRADIVVEMARALGTSVEYLVNGHAGDPWMIEHALFLRECKQLSEDQLFMVKNLVHMQLSQSSDNDEEIGREAK